MRRIEFIVNETVPCAHTRLCSENQLIWLKRWQQYGRKIENITRNTRHMELP